METQFAETAIQNAYAELKNGNKPAARSWAQRAAELAPEQEDSWLVLAALAEPHAGLEYLKVALRINPDSQRARQGLLDIQRKLEKISRKAAIDESLPILAETALQPGKTASKQFPSFQASNPVRNNRPLHPWWVRWFISAALAIGIFFILGHFLLQARIVQAESLPISGQKIAALLQIRTPTSTPTETPQPTSTPTFTPTPTDTPSPTDTPTPTDTPSPTITPTPTDTASPTDTPSPTVKPFPTKAPAVSNPVAPAASARTNGGKRILVNISQQHLYAYQGGTLVYSFVVSTGAQNATRVGTFTILDKIPDAWSDPWGFWMPYWMGIYWVGNTENGIHALPVLTNGNVIWGDGLGTPISHGCIVLSTGDARLLFRWTEVGTQVQITW